MRTGQERFTHVELTSLDRVTISGRHFRVELRNDGDDDVFLLRDEENVARPRAYDAFEIADGVAKRQLIISRGFYGDEKAFEERRQRLDTSAIPGYIMYRVRMVKRYLELVQDGTFTRSQINEFYDYYTAENERQLPAPRAGRKKIIVETHDRGSPRNFQRWVARFVASGENPFSLMPQYKGSYYHDPKFTPEVNKLLDEEAKKLANAKRASIALHFRLLEIDNKAREYPRELCDLRTFYRRVAAQKKMLIDMGQNGADAAKDTYQLSKTATRKFRPLERVEMDEDKLDIIALLKGTRLWNIIHPKIQLEIEKRRFWASVAIDCGTRSILAFRLLDSDPHGRSAVETLHMAVMPKTGIVRWAGTTADWIQFGVPECVATDHGAAYLDEDFQSTVLSLCGTHLLPPTSNPGLRGRIERFFRTEKGWLRLFSGQTFSNPIERGNYDSKANASMDFEELARCLVRLIVDAYHLTRHKGLGDIKPIDAWATMTKGRRVKALTDPEEEGRIFGLNVGTRKITDRGVVCLGIPYYDDRLQQIVAHYKKAEIIVRSNPYDLGMLGFRTVKDRGFYYVKAAVHGFDGVSAIEWAAARKLMKEAYSQHDTQDEKIVAEALNHVRSVAKVAEDRHNISSHVLVQQDYDRMERELFAGYVVHSKLTMDYDPDPETFLLDQIGRDGVLATMTDPPLAEHVEEGVAVSASSKVFPSEGTFNPSQFQHVRTEEGIPEPITTPPPLTGSRPKKKKEKAPIVPTIADLLRGGPARGAEAENSKTSGRRSKLFDASGSDEDATE
ncbi:hypothetical protein [Rhizobium sp. BE258]|uniref:hypothetical protein n=1 Tax=Rhizobium sp. BE258 TaxID=2817722 RepID=UPI00285C8661|nr:hypothetical protein [Rhizobium sp. BE258]MDR7141945.1 putative transposase [Rhizobium sp. BE258]